MILDELAAYAEKRVEQAKQVRSLEELRTAAFGRPKGDFLFERTLQKPGMSLICEVKKASPSKGVISEAFPYLSIAKGYEAAGADCVSCLTEPKWFLGSDAVFREIRAELSIPMLRKDFTVDEYQLYEAKCMGADAVLLICALLSEREISRFLAVCDELGMSALVEAHDEHEVAAAVAAGARVIGVNNRNLKDFTVDLKNAGNLRKQVPNSAIFVSESGVSKPEDVAALRQAGADAVLIGEALMRAEDPRALLAAFRRAGQ